MARFSHLSPPDLIQGIRENDHAQIRANDALKEISNLKTLAHAQAAKETFIYSTVGLIEALQQEASDLTDELARRLPK
jgi:hypothetical protein